MMRKVIIMISIVIGVLILLLALFFIQKKYHIFSSKITKDIIEIKEEKTIEGKRLIIKDNAEYNKLIEFEFENNIVSRIKIYEQFETEEEYEKAKESNKYINSINILRQNDKERFIFIEKTDLGTDKDLSYDEIYYKYLVQIIDAYKVIK